MKCFVFMLWLLGIFTIQSSTLHTSYTDHMYDLHAIDEKLTLFLRIHFYETITDTVSQISMTIEYCNLLLYIFSFKENFTNKCSQYISKGSN